MNEAHMQTRGKVSVRCTIVKQWDLMVMVSRERGEGSESCLSVKELYTSCKRCLVLTTSSYKTGKPILFAPQNILTSLLEPYLWGRLG